MSRLSRNYNNRRLDAIEQNLVDYEDLRFGKLNTDLDIRDTKYNHKMREDFDSKITQIDAHSAKILWCINNFLVSKSWERSKCDDADYINLLQSHLRKFNDPIREFKYLNEYKTDKLLADVYFMWFKDDLRRSLFIASLIEGYIKEETYQGELELLEAISDYLRYKHPRFRFDCELPKYQLIARANSDEDVRSRHIELVKSTYFNNCVSYKDVKWIVPSDVEQIDWAYDYLEKAKEKQNKKDEDIDKDGDEESYIPLKRIFFPQNTQEKYELILASIDRISNVEDPPYSTKASGSFSERGSVLYKMEKAWRSRKTSIDTILSSNDITVKLNKKNRDTLNKLAGNSKAEIDKLINKSIEEYVKKLSSSS